MGPGPSLAIDLEERARNSRARALLKVQHNREQHNTRNYDDSQEDQNSELGLFVGHFLCNRWLGRPYSSREFLITSTLQFSELIKVIG